MTPLIDGRPALRRVLDEATGTTPARIDRALRLLLDLLGMDVAFIGEFHDGARVVTHAATAPGLTPVPVGLSHPTEETLCHLFAAGEVDPIIADTNAHPRLADHPHTALYNIGAYAGVPLVGEGSVVGVLCCSASTPVQVIEGRDLTTLQTVAEYVSGLLGSQANALSDVAPLPAQSQSQSAKDALDRVAGALAEGQSIETLSRPLLMMLQEATGLDSTYLTAIDWAANEQHILYSVNNSEMQIPEGLVVDWSDTLCRRSLDEGRQYTADVPSIWGDSEAAAALGIHTYVSVPVLDTDSTAIGTLCGASSEAVHVDPRHLATMRMFAVLIGQQIQARASATAQEQRAAELRSRLIEVDDLALRDPLTGLFNRRGIERWLAAASANLRPGVEQLAVGFCDLDDFKRINDTLGHAAGDDALRAFASAIRTVGRDGDLHGRLGGDEFVVAAVLPGSSAALGAWTDRLRRAAQSAVVGGASTLRQIGSSVGVATFTEATTPSQALSVADEAMYQEKVSRRDAS